MAYYALIDSNNIVTQVIKGNDEGGDTDWEVYYGNFHGCTVKRTSYNTFGNVHAGGGTPFRKNFAGVGYTYDSTKDAFIAPRPSDTEEITWIFNETTCLWESSEK
jgi:hypothetical protein